MDNQTNFQQIEHENSNAVVSFDNGTTFKISNLMKQLNNLLIKSVLNNLLEHLKQVGLGTPPNYRENWNKAVDAEILEPQSGVWKKGKLRMRVILEFCPDEPEEKKVQNNGSLDDIRQTLS
jgi:hypothetical protein